VCVDHVVIPSMLKISFVIMFTQVAAQLGAMRDENKRVWEQLMEEKRGQL